MIVVRAVVSLEATVFFFMKEQPGAVLRPKEVWPEGSCSNPRLTPVAGFWQEDIKRMLA